MRCLKFYAVGAIGIVVQATTLAFLVHIGFHYLWATALAVEAAILHNFAWHWKWTWADRCGNGSAAVIPMLLRFHLATGLISLVGNLLFMRILAGSAKMDPVLANLLSIALCSLVNFLLSDRVVFVLPGASIQPRWRNPFTLREAKRPLR
ncbi:MAG: GtrA family protein [Acidobacteria bacterium]|nr:GtrA family protein [Acidobacteriota bacterium]